MWYLSSHVRLHKTEIYICIVSCSWKIPFKKVPQYSEMRKNITTMKEKDGNDQWRNQVFSLKRRCQSHFFAAPFPGNTSQNQKCCPFRAHQWGECGFFVKSYLYYCGYWICFWTVESSSTKGNLTIAKNHAQKHLSFSSLKVEIIVQI